MKKQPKFGCGHFAKETWRDLILSGMPNQKVKLQVPAETLNQHLTECESCQLAFEDYQRICYDD